MGCFKEIFSLKTQDGELIRGEHREHSTGRIYAIVFEHPNEALMALELNADELQELIFKLQELLV